MGFFTDEIDRVDGKAKVTGTAQYAYEYNIPNVVYGVLVGSTIAKGTITDLDTKECRTGSRCAWCYQSS